MWKASPIYFIKYFFERGVIANTVLLERFEKDGNFENFDERDAICLLLDLANCKGNRLDLAAGLLEEFGSLKSVLEAREEQLIKMEGISRKAAAMIRMIIPFTKVWERINMDNPLRIGNAREAEAYCKSLLIGYRYEVFYVVCLNTKCKILGKRKISDGSISEVNSYPRIIMETALNYNATSILLTHNHPGGTLFASPEDINSTRTIQKLMNGVGIMVLDHIIVSGNDAYSMIQHGDITYKYYD